MTRRHRSLILALSLFVLGLATDAGPASEEPHSFHVQRKTMEALSAPDSVRVSEQGISSPLAACTLQWQGSVSFREKNSLAGGYRLSAYQDPAAEGCPGPYPFGVTQIWWTVYFAMDVPIQVQPVLFEDTGTVSCPVPGGIFFAGPMYILDIPATGPWIIRMSLADTVCVNSPYFAGIRILSAIDTGIVDILIDGMAPRVCRTYRDTANGWSDLVADDGFVHNMQIWSSGLDQSQNGCPIPNQCPINVSASPNPVTAMAGVQASATVTASDPDGGGALRYHLVSGPGSLDSTSGAWTYTPTCADVPGFVVTVQATDRGSGGCPQSQIAFPVNVSPPSLSVSNCLPVSVHWGSLASLQLTAQGGCPPVIFTKLSGSGSVTPAGNWEFQTDCGDIGTDSVKIQATDAAGQSTACAFDVTVTNTSPICQSPVAASSPPGQLTQVPLGPVTDADGDPLFYFLISGPPWGGVNGINWTATRPVADLADYTVCYISSDGCQTSAQCCFLVTESCQCNCHADPQCDGARDILDVVLTVNRAFRGAAPISFCPGHPEVDGRTDVDCSGATDVIDVIKMIDVAFRGADPASKFCAPCAP